MSKYFSVPFASGGDKTVVPDASQPSGSVNYTDGWGPLYQADQLTNPQALDVDRASDNQIYFDITEVLKEVQDNGVLPWRTDANYVVGATALGSDGLNYVALIANQGVDPVGDLTGTWIPLHNYIGQQDIDFTGVCTFSNPLQGSAIVNNAQISDSSISTSKYQDYSITQTKLATGSVVAAKIAYNAINNDKILNNTINGGQKLLDSSVSGNKISNNTITDTQVSNSFRLVSSGARIAASGSVTSSFGQFLSCERYSTGDYRITISGNILSNRSVSIMPIGSGAGFPRTTAYVSGVYDLPADESTLFVNTYQQNGTLNDSAFSILVVNI
jgi:hypothetical protein